jgi:predicted Zn-dependent peptidase
MEFGASVRHDKVGALVKSLVAEVNDLVKRAPQKNELTRLVDRNVRDTRDNLSEVTAIADAAGKGVLFDQPWQPKATLERIAAVRAVDVHRAARASFTGENATLVLVGLPPRREVATATRALESLA